MPTHRRAGLLALSLLALPLAGCKPENKYVAPPPAEIAVAVPLQQSVVPYLELTGNTVAFNTVDLVARVEGFLTSIDYKDGASVKKGDLLFQIDPTIYDAKVKQAVAELESAKAQVVVTKSDFTRQETLLRQAVTAQNTYDQAKAKYDSALAGVDNQQASLIIAQTNLGYTKVLAPFDGVMTRHLISTGELVGNTTTKLASIVQLDPLYVTFNMSEQDILQVRSNLADHKMTREQIGKVPVEIGLMNEQGFPHRGKLQYVSPDVDTATGTILVRALFDNPDRALLPGFFVRVRMPMGLQAKAALLVPDRLLAADQAGSYLLVVNKDDVVEQRRVTTGQLLPGNLRVIATGLAKEDRVVATTSGQAIPGSKVRPKPTTIEAPSATPPAAAPPPSK